MNTIIIELSQVDRERLDKITELLMRQANCAHCGAAAQAFIEKGNEVIQKAKEEAKQVKVEDFPADEPLPFDPPTEEPVAAVSVSDLQKKFVDLAGTGKREEAKAIIKEYAERISLVPEDKRSETMQRLIALEG